MKKGYISIHRTIQDHWLWMIKPFDKRSAWIDLLLLANHESKKVFWKGELIDVQRGQVFRSLSTLANRWGWSKSGTQKFIILLKRDTMIDTKKIRRGMIVTICNYNEFQQTGKVPSGRKSSRDVTRSESEVHLHTIMKNNDNNNTPKKSKHQEFVFLTNEEHTKLVKAFGGVGVADRIGRLNDYIGSTGKKYKSHYHTILNWERMAKAKEPKPKGGGYMERKMVK